MGNMSSAIWHDIETRLVALDRDAPAAEVMAAMLKMRAVEPGSERERRALCKGLGRLHAVARLRMPNVAKEARSRLTSLAEAGIPLASFELARLTDEAQAQSPSNAETVPLLDEILDALGPRMPPAKLEEAFERLDGFEPATAFQHRELCRGLAKIFQFVGKETTVGRQTVDRLRSLAENGSAAAECELGRIAWAEGDLDGARQRFESAAEKGDPAALTDLAHKLHHRAGRHEGSDAEKLSLFERASNLGDPRASFWLSNFYKSQDPHASHRFLVRAVSPSSGLFPPDPVACVVYGIQQASLRKFAEAFKFLRMGSRKSPLGKVALARLLLSGNVNQEAAAAGIDDTRAAAASLLEEVVNQPNAAFGRGFARKEQPKALTQAKYELAKLQMQVDPASDELWMLLKDAADGGHPGARSRYAARLEQLGHQELADAYRPPPRTRTPAHDLDFRAWATRNIDELRDNFKRQNAELLQAGMPARVLDRVDAMIGWAAEAGSVTGPIVISDPMIWYQRGQANRDLDRYAEAAQDFQDALSRNGQDGGNAFTAHCHTALGECAEAECDHAKALAHFTEAFYAAPDAAIWRRCAKSAAASGNLLTAFQMLQSLAEKWPVGFEGRPAVSIGDPDPQRTVAQAALLAWRMTTSGDSQQASMSAEWALAKVLSGIQAMSLQRRFDDGLVVALAAGAKIPEVEAILCDLLRDLGKGGHAPENGRRVLGTHFFAHRNRVRVLHAVLDGLSEGNGFSVKIAFAAIDQIRRSPFSVVLEPALAGPILRLVWRTLVRAYYGENESDSFRRSAIELVGQLAAVLPTEAIDDVLFELLVSDLAAQEHALLGQYVDRLLDPRLVRYAHSPVEEVARSLSKTDGRDVSVLAARLSDQRLMLDVHAYGDLATVAPEEVAALVRQRLQQSFLDIGLPHTISVSVEGAANSPCSAKTTGQAARVLEEWFAVRGGPIAPIIAVATGCSASIVLTGCRLSVEVQVEVNAAALPSDVVARACVQLDKKSSGILSRSALGPESGVAIEVAFDLAPAARTESGMAWADLFHEVARRHAAPADFETAHSGLRSRMPTTVGRPFAFLPDHLAEIVHAACDTYHLALAERVLRVEPHRPGILGEAHALKRSLLAIADGDGDVEAQMVNFRIALSRLSKITQAALPHETDSWSPTSFDLRDELVGAAGIASRVMGTRPTIVGDPSFMVTAPRLPVLTAFQELMRNAAAHTDPARLNEIGVHFKFRKRTVTLINPVDRSRTTADSAFSSKRGLALARSYLEESGFSLDARDRGSLFVVKIKGEG